MSRITDESKRRNKEQLLMLVRRHRGLREAEISHLLSMERRTVNNYLNELEREGKVYKEGVQWFADPDAGSWLRRFELAADEAFTLYLAARQFVKQTDKQNPIALSALSRLAEVLKTDLPVSNQIFTAAQELRKRKREPGYEDIFTNVVKAYLLRHPLQLTYRTTKDFTVETVFKTYLIEPSAIGFTLYLIGHSAHVNALRSYKIERIVTAVPDYSQTYTIPADFPGLDILQNAWSIMIGETTERVVLRFSRRVKKRVLETNWHPSQGYLEEADGKLRWWVDVADTTDMKPWIRGWGADVEVLEPQTLQEELKRHARRLAKIYGVAVGNGSDPDARLLRLWGKTTKRDEELFHPALYHMLDVAHVAQQLLSSRASPRWRQVLARALDVDAANLHEWLPWFIALHDIGKISTPFQAQNVAQKQRLESEGFEFGRYAVEHKELHHTIIGRAALQNWDWIKALPRSWRTVFLDMVSGHHGIYQQPELKHNQLLATLKEPEAWDTLRQHTFAILKNCVLLNQPADWPSPENISAAIVALNGFAILCDWLGSDEQFFTPKPNTPILAYLPISRQKAKERVESAGFFAPAVSAAATTFSGLFGWTARPLQQAIDDIPSHLLTEPTLTIIEAPTGEGKTEAALTLARRIAQAQGTDEMYVALPTTATSNAMYQRLQEHLRDRLSLPPELAQLVHGQAFLLQDDLRITPLDDADGDSHPALTWFEPKKKSLLSPFGVGTVDQAELAALNVKHNALRLIGLAGKVVILDEVHAYDAYMTTIIARMLQWLAALGSSVVLLSATLPTAKRQQLIEAYTGGHVSPPETEDYPYLLTVNGAAFHAANPPAEKASKIIHLHTLHFVEDDWAGKAAWLLGQTADGGCVCWITNTVERAQRIFEALRAIAPDDLDCLLLHARFPLAERQEIEKVVLAKYGKEAAERPLKGVVIGTQVLEQSLDIDFDLIVTDLAPIDLVLQRIGRLHRHERPNRPPTHTEPSVFVNCELDDAGELKIGSDRFYTPYILLKSWQAIQAKASDPGRFDLPTDYRPLIEAVYDETPPAHDSPLFLAWEKRRRKEVKLGDEAELRLAKKPDPRRSFWKHDGITFHEDEDSNDWITAQTRYQERETITVIPLEKVDGENGRLPSTTESFPIAQSADRDQQLRLLQYSVRISRPEIVKALKAAERPTLFMESALLKRCYPLWLENGFSQVDNLLIRLDPQLGIVIEKGE